MQIGVMSPEVTDKESADWGHALEDIFINDVPGSMSSTLNSTRLYLSHPTSIDNAIGESVGAPQSPLLKFPLLCSSSLNLNKSPSKLPQPVMAGCNRAGLSLVRKQLTV